MGTREHPDMTQQHRVTRLNPYAFPPETNVRFALLLAAAVALALNLTLLTFGQIGLLDVTLASPDGLLLVDEATGQVEIDRVRLGELQTSVFAGWLIIGLSCAYGLALFGAAWLIHRRHPRRIARRKGLDPWPEGRDPDFISALADLCRRAGVDPPPDILVATGSGLTDGQVFGFRRRYSLRLGSRMPLLMRKRPEKFRAVILHELGHIVNGDVARTYFTQALWITVLIVAVLPVTAFIVYNVTDATLLRLNALASGGDLQLERLFFVNIPIWLLIGGQFTLIVLIVGLIRAGLLREREMYADWRAALWGARTTIAGILQAHASHDEERHGPFSLHPDPAARLETLR
ncbi:MAG: M48 family metalloprotease, partial [Chloroflexi bacterium]|nr:M48 family metalloprotease [Chloroflexota bacterium]